jgi:uncharacterized protein YndB with AHSA1/START domain
MANPTVEKIGMYKTESLVKHTKKSWDEWLAILEKAGGRQLEHRDLAELLRRKYKLTTWWQHVVAGGYEIHIGRKVEGRNAKGRWSLTATKSLPSSAKKTWDFLVSEEGQRVWLKPLDPVEVGPKVTFESEDGYYGEFRTMKKGVRVRMTWSDPDWDRHSFVQLFVVKRPGEKCLAAVMHTDLPDSRSRDRMRVRWKEALERVASEIKATSSDRTLRRSRR